MEAAGVSIDKMRIEDKASGFSADLLNAALKRRRQWGTTAST